MKQKVVTVGLDLAKNVFQVHAIGAGGEVLFRRKLRRAEVLPFFTDVNRRPKRTPYRRAKGTPLPSSMSGMTVAASALVAT